MTCPMQAIMSIGLVFIWYGSGAVDLRMSICFPFAPNSGRTVDVVALLSWARNGREQLQQISSLSEQGRPNPSGDRKPRVPSFQRKLSADFTTHIAESDFWYTHWQSIMLDRATLADWVDRATFLRVLLGRATRWEFRPLRG
jgi:hypothetical protein